MKTKLTFLVFLLFAIFGYMALDVYTLGGHYNKASMAGLIAVICTFVLNFDGFKE